MMATFHWTGLALTGADSFCARQLCFIAYARDEAKARAGQWRTPENTLLLLGLLDGWPGGLLAQRLLRHKSRKTALRVRCKISALLNRAALARLAGQDYSSSPFSVSTS